MTSCVLADCGRQMVGIAYCAMHGRRLERNGFTREMTAEDWFFRHVAVDENECWNYGPVHPTTGYAQFTVANGTKGVRAHRWSFEHFIAPIPEGLEIDHLCTNTACVNPWHLDPVTHKVNVNRGVGSAPTCVNGHPFDTENTASHSRGHRACRTCARERSRRYQSLHDPAV